MKLTSTPNVREKFKSYPSHIRPKIKQLRKLILDTAKEIELPALEETLKWGEPSYLAKKGSTIRIDWKTKKPDQYAIYFKCTSKLVVTFIKVFGDKFNYENHRAILFGLEDKIPEKELKRCIAAALRYHEVKDEQDLGLLRM